jgi:hypothetical protein
MICSQASDGNLYYKRDSQEICEGAKPSCLSDTHLCGQLVEGEGTECPENFVASCETGEIRVECEYDEIQDMQVIKAKPCQSGLICAIDDQGIPGCFESCPTEGETDIRCEDGYSNSYVCTALGEQRLWILDDYISCLHGCSTSDNTCLKLSDQEDQSCVSESFEPRCDGTDVLLTCNSASFIEATSCNQEYRPGYICNNGKCVEPCTTIGEIKYDCLYSDVTELHKYICSESGTQKIWNDDTSAVELCESNICDSAYGKCMPACDETAFEPRCDGRFGIICDSGYEFISADCGDGYCHILDIDGNLQPSCLHVEEECAVPGDRESNCSIVDGSSYEGYRSCRTSTDGKNYYFYELDYACSGSCNTEGTACE